MKYFTVLLGIVSLMLVGAGCGSSATDADADGLFSGSSQQGEAFSNSGQALPIRRNEPTQFGPQ